jgi:hypothetical protein
MLCIPHQILFGLSHEDGDLLASREGLCFVKLVIELAS